MKRIFLALFSVAILFSCKPDPTPAPADPNLVFQFTYIFRPSNTFNSEPKFNGKSITEYYNPKTDALLIYLKEPSYINNGSGPTPVTNDKERSVLLPTMLDDSTKITYDISQGAFFLYALKPAPGNLYDGFKNSKYAFGTKDTVMFFKAVIIKGTPGLAQSN